MFTEHILAEDILICFMGKKVVPMVFSEDWTASVVRAFNPGRKNIAGGEGITEDGHFVSELTTGEMKCLVKLLDSAERLVIQVHPTVEFAKKYFKS